MDFKQYYNEIVFDVNKRITDRFSAKQGDTSSRGFYVTIVQNGVVIPVTNETMTFYALKPDGHKVLDSAVIDGTQFRIDIHNQTFAAPGVVKCELTLFGTSGEKISSKTFDYVVEEILSENAELSTDQISILDEALLLEGRVTTLENNEGILDGRVTQNELDITSLEGRVGTLETDLPLLDGRVTQNESDISSNATEINNLQTKTDLTGVYSLSTSGTDTYTVTNPYIESYYNGLKISVKIGILNTGASTININTLGTVSLKKQDGSEFLAGELKAGESYPFEYNGTEFRSLIPFIEVLEDTVTDHESRISNNESDISSHESRIIKLESHYVPKHGVRIDKTNSNPLTRVAYIGDSVGFTPMSGGNGSFSWGSWESVFNDLEIKPCVLQNKSVKYYLDPDNFTLKSDGTASILDGTDGDVMIEFGKTIWYKWTDEGATYTIEFSEVHFPGAVKYAFETEDGYNQMLYYPLLLTQILFVIFFKSTDSQLSLGRGYVDGNVDYITTGNTNNKGMFYGSSNGAEQMKFLGIEDFWGNKLFWIDGIATNASWELLIGNSNFNDSGSDYLVYQSGISADTAGYINTVQGGNDRGFIINGSTGSSSTYYADYGVLYSSRVASFGGRRTDGSGAGFAQLRLADSASAVGAYIGARLFCASNGKFYIGAYLGQTIATQLRSVSGVLPSNTKTIGAFRAEAQANN